MLVSFFHKNTSRILSRRFSLAGRNSNQTLISLTLKDFIILIFLIGGSLLLRDQYLVFQKEFRLLSLTLIDIKSNLNDLRRAQLAINIKQQEQEIIPVPVLPIKQINPNILFTFYENNPTICHVLGTALALTVCYCTLYYSISKIIFFYNSTGIGRLTTVVDKGIGGTADVLERTSDYVVRKLDSISTGSTLSSVSGADLEIVTTTSVSEYFKTADQLKLLRYNNVPLHRVVDAKTKELFFLTDQDVLKMTNFIKADGIISAPRFEVAFTGAEDLRFSVENKPSTLPSMLRTESGVDLVLLDSDPAKDSAKKVITSLSVEDAVTKSDFILSSLDFWK